MGVMILNDVMMYDFFDKDRFLFICENINLISTTRQFLFVSLVYLMNYESNKSETKTKICSYIYM